MTHPLLTPYRLRLRDYQRMIEAGILSEDDQVELIEGQIITMSPKGSKHAACLGKINDWLTPLLDRRAQLRIQDPIQIPDLSQPEPDLALVIPRADYYAEAHPTPADVILLVEVADSSTRIDREVKAPVYAQAGIAIYWIINLPEQSIEVYSQPQGKRYQQRQPLGPDAQIEIPGLDLRTPVAAWLI